MFLLFQVSTLKGLYQIRITPTVSLKQNIPKKQGIITEYDTIIDVSAIEPRIRAMYPKRVLKNSAKP